MRARPMETAPKVPRVEFIINYLARCCPVRVLPPFHVLNRVHVPLCMATWPLAPRAQVEFSLSVPSPSAVARVPCVLLCT